MRGKGLIHTKVARCICALGNGRGARAEARGSVGRARALLLAMLLISLVGVSSCGKSSSEGPRVVVIGFDGMDPRMCSRLMDAGKMPNLAKLRDAGGFKPLGTTIPPQSPVAWASFITGSNPGVHGIYDFIHRDPSKQASPYYSAAETVEGDKGWEVGDYNIPLTFWPFNHAPTQTLLRRDGKPFWDYLDEAGIPSRIYDIPANYPPSESKHGHMCCLSGMGVPDLHGGYGTYQTYYSLTFVSAEDAEAIRHSATFRGDTAKAKIFGPMNTALKKPKRANVDFLIHRSPDKDEARIDIQGRTILLKAGEWSDWVQLDFEMSMPPFLPAAHVSGIVRFYLQSVRPHFKLYVTPINIDPSDPGGQKISEPDDFVTELSDELGFFYTSGFQEDYNALKNRVFTEAEFKVQADYVLKERLELLDLSMNTYEDGLLFFYFSSTDLQGHMFWWDTDAKHPTRDEATAKKYHQAMIDLYVQMDDVVGRVLERFGDSATVMVMSDHGFANFRRQVNLGTWLRDEGYLHPPDTRSILNPAAGQLVDWAETRAYALGLNGLYVNLKGRERDGIVDPTERDVLLDEITKKLLALRDPANGDPVIKTVYRAEEVYRGANVSKAPDLIIGYHRGYRASWVGTLGDMSKEVIEDNDSDWSADHCMAADEVPGVIFANRRIEKANPSLVDMAPTILSAFGLEVPAHMEGGSLFEASAAKAASDTHGTTEAKGATRGGEDQAG